MGSQYYHGLPILDFSSSASLSPLVPILQFRTFLLSRILDPEAVEKLVAIMRQEGVVLNRAVCSFLVYREIRRMLSVLLLVLLALAPLYVLLVLLVLFFCTSSPLLFISTSSFSSSQNFIYTLPGFTFDPRTLQFVDIAGSFPLDGTDFTDEHKRNFNAYADFHASVNWGDCHFVERYMAAFKQFACFVLSGNHRYSGALTVAQTYPKFIAVTCELTCYL